MRCPLKCISFFHEIQVRAVPDDTACELLKISLCIPLCSHYRQIILKYIPHSQAGKLPANYPLSYSYR